MTQFNKSASVTIGPPGGSGIQISKLRIVFDIVRNLEKTPNTCTVQIYNLNEQSRNKIDLALPKDKEPAQKLFLNAGYLEGDGEEAIFVGDVTEVSHTHSIPDIVTTIEAQDGVKSLTETKANLSFGKGISGNTVLNSILKLFPNAKDLANVTIPNKVYASGFAFSGQAKIALSKVASTLDLEWSMQNDVIKLLNFDTNDGSRIVFISPKTGLLNSPKKINTAKRKAKGESKQNKPGWELNTLLQPKVIPGGNISVKSREISDTTVFKVVSVLHNGDTHGNDWRSIIEVTE